MSNVKKLKLYGYWRSSATWRIRWALELKKVVYEYAPINLLTGENKDPAFLKINPAGRLPALDADGTILVQSSAILEWIEENYTSGQPLLPKNGFDRAYVRSLAQIINADTTPLQTPLAQNAHSNDPAEKKRWAQLFIRRGLKDFDEASKARRGQYSLGDSLTLADLFLVPQIYNAKRFEIAVEQEFPNLATIYQRALETPACLKASPEKQPDAPA
jgi:maleylacetoacetate isomerase